MEQQKQELNFEDKPTTIIKGINVIAGITLVAGLLIALIVFGSTAQHMGGLVLSIYVVVYSVLTSFLLKGFSKLLEFQYETYKAIKELHQMIK